jgi:hypothetical protein
VELNTTQFIIMVTVINYKKRQAENGREFFALEVQGGIEMVKSHETGNYYAQPGRAALLQPLMN